MSGCSERVGEMSHKSDVAVSETGAVEENLVAIDEKRGENETNDCKSLNGHSALPSLDSAFSTLDGFT
jgi:hypothetical protein